MAPLDMVVHLLNKKKKIFFKKKNICAFYKIYIICRKKIFLYQTKILCRKKAITEKNLFSEKNWRNIFLFRFSLFFSDIIVLQKNVF